ncbi:MAG: TonB family protein [Burkholderiaceae bacterium]
MNLGKRQHAPLAPIPTRSAGAIVSPMQSPEAFWRDEDPRARRRWSTCLFAAAALHIAPIVVAAWWLEPVALAPAPPPLSAILIEEAPKPAVAPAPPTAIPPGPQQQRVQRRVERHVERPKPARPVETPPLSPVPQAALTLPSSSEPEPPPPQVEDKPPVEQTTAPPSALAPPAPAAAPTPSHSDAPSLTPPDWQAMLLGQLERFKRYPSEAQFLRQQGVTHLRFTMNRDGKVLTFRVEKSSGNALLDQEALALIQRAQPLPKPPASVMGDTLELVVPIEFFLTRRR